ncbi:hypothetical protein [Rudanella lutea]|uniref:hypothetical protein n=1 Tax=Rudanella lutea TaxID=451374 RepID=UPI000377F2C1|nr:hypothetical protein [Rudanella lutea]
MNQLTLPLSNVQTELLRLYATDLSESDLLDLKQLLANFYAERSIKRANQIWDERGLTNDDMLQWLEKD